MPWPGKPVAGAEVLRSPGSRDDRGFGVPQPRPRVPRVRATISCERRLHHL